MGVLDNITEEFVKLTDNISGHVAPIQKREVEEFKLLVAEEVFLSENTDSLVFSEGISPELSSILIGLSTGVVGVGAVFAVFAGMSGAEIMTALAAFGVSGAVGGIASVAALVAAPIVLASGGAYYITNQKKLGNELAELFKESLKVEKILKDDNRDNVKGLLIATSTYRKKLSDKHHDLRKLQ